MRGQFLKGHLDFLILSAAESQQLHGYALIEELRKRSGGAFDLPEGTIYPALHRLERAKLLASRWSEYAGRRRRVYRLTQRGHRVLAQQRNEWRSFSTAISAVLGTT